MSVFKIAGFDPSIASTGKTIMRIDPETFNILGLKYYAYHDTKIRCNVDDDMMRIDCVGTKYSKLSIIERQDIAYSILDIDMDDVKYVAFEGYAYSKARNSSSSNSRGMMQLGEFIGTLKYRYAKMGMGILVYPSTSVKKLATGNGTADKLPMRDQIKHDYPEYYHPYFDSLIQWPNPASDMCDSFWICESLRIHMKYELLGESALSDVELYAITTHTAKSEPIAGTKLIKL